MVAVAVAMAGVLVSGCSDDHAGLTSADVQDARDSLRQQAGDTIARALYENPGSREQFLDQAREDPDDQALVAEITADGEFTLEEFRQLSDVRDAVLTYSGEIVTSFERDLVEAVDP
ncbi:MAG: hypothetical protein ACFCUP_09135 [Actinomycetales bacterium]